LGKGGVKEGLGEESGVKISLTKIWGNFKGYNEGGKKAGWLMVPNGRGINNWDLRGTAKNAGKKNPRESGTDAEGWGSLESERLRGGHEEEYNRKTNLKR